MNEFKGITLPDGKTYTPLGGGGSGKSSTIFDSKLITVNEDNSQQDILKIEVPFEDASIDTYKRHNIIIYFDSGSVDFTIQRIEVSLPIPVGADGTWANYRLVAFYNVKSQWGSNIFLTQIRLEDKSTPYQCLYAINLNKFVTKGDFSWTAADTFKNGGIVFNAQADGHFPKFTYRVILEEIQ